MEELFLSSALGDSSLALPGPPAPGSGPKQRSVRVQQQVQMTMARRARRTTAAGGFHFQKSRAKSFDDTETLLRTTQGADLGIVNPSFSGGQMRPSRRVDVSPPATPGFTSFSSTPHRGTATHPGLRQSRRMHPLSDGSFLSNTFWCCTAPVVPTFHGRPLFPSPVQQGTLSGSQRSSGQQRLGEGGDCGGTEHRGFRRMASRQTSFGGVTVEADGWSPLEDPPRIQTRNVPTTKSGVKASEMTVERAVSLLRSNDEDTLLRAAGHLQSECFRSADAKKTVHFLRGIEKLVQLLRSDSDLVQRIAAAALRNAVYLSSENKMEVGESGGVAGILGALRGSRDVETRRELTGLLWNLSSHEPLKERLSAEAPSVLTRSVLVPTSGISEGENPKDELLADAAAFHNAVGCLRNLSSAGPDTRRTMRECEDLIDSLVYYVRGAIADYKTDDESTEHCVCILRNLSYRMEEELQGDGPRVLREPRSSAPGPRALGCFAHRSTKITELEERRPLLEEKPNPRGSEWLWSTIGVRMYVSLLARSARPATQEAALGALQNITAGSGALSEAITCAVVRRENVLQHVRKTLEEGGDSVTRVAVALIRNVCRYPELHPLVVQQVLPELVRRLPSDGLDDDLEDGPVAMVTVSLCHALNSLSLSGQQHTAAIVNEGGLPRIVDISRRNGPSRAGRAARVLLHTMWKYSDLHVTFRKCGFSKADFIHTRSRINYT